MKAFTFFHIAMKILWILLTCLTLCNAGKRDTDGIKNAMSMVENGKSIRRAALENGIPESTLRDYISGRRDINQESQRGSNRILTPSQENDLVNYITWMSDRGFPLTTTIIQSLACEISTKSPTLRWVQMFLKRHNLSLVMAKQYNRGKCSTVSHEAVDQHFKLLKEFLEKHQIKDPAKILNIDETGWGKSQTVFTKVAVPKGSKSHFQRSTYSNDHTTSVHCAAANGKTLPTMVIYKNCIPRWLSTEGLPADWEFTASESGFINSELFYQWMEKILVPYVRRVGPPVVLTLDQATPHLSVRVLKLAIKHGIELFAFLPGASYLLQPLDQVFYLLKTAFAHIAVRLCLVAAAFIVNKAKFASVLVQAEKTAFTQDAIQKAFQKTGIHPLNPNAIDRSKIPIPKHASSCPSSEPSTSTSSLSSEPSPSSSSPSSEPSTSTSSQPVTSTHPGTPSSVPTPSTSSNPNTPSSDNTPASSEPCQECGRKDPCPTCVIGRNPLLKLGILKDSTCAKILFPPTLPTKTPSAKKRKLATSKVLTCSELICDDESETESVEDMSDKPKRSRKSASKVKNTKQTNSSSPLNNSELNDIVEAEDVVDTRAERPKRSKKESKVTKKNKQSNSDKKGRKKVSGKTESVVEESSDEYHQSFICEICGRRGKEEDSPDAWIGCDQEEVCNRWFHYGCLPYMEQIKVDLSIVEGSEWYCEECCEVNGSERVPCDVCMEEVEKDPTGNVAICSGCSGVCHKDCLSIDEQISYFEYITRGFGTWLCNNCSSDDQHVPI